MTVVSDAGPLIALAKADKLRLLEDLFGRVQVPPAVHRELLAKSAPEAKRLDDALGGFVIVAEVPRQPPEVLAATQALGPGEQEAIALAHALKAVLLIDDQAARIAARRLDLNLTGVAGLLIRAKEAGLIAGVCPLLEEIRQRGYWLSDELLSAAARLAGEDRAPSEVSSSDPLSLRPPS